MNPTRTAEEILKSATISVDPGNYFLVALKTQDWTRLLENPELSPRGAEPFMVLRDRHEVTLLLDEVDWKTMRHAAREGRVESGFRLLTFEMELGWEVVGFLALVTEILADAEIPVGALSAFSRDHLLIKQEHLPKTLLTLGKYVKELC